MDTELKERLDLLDAKFALTQWGLTALVDIFTEDDPDFPQRFEDRLDETHDAVATVLRDRNPDAWALFLTLRAEFRTTL